MKRSVICCALIVGIIVGWSSGSGTTVIEPGFDLWHTPSGGATTVATPFGVIELEGKPIGPADTDTIIKRTNPTPNPIPANTTDTFDIEIGALSLQSVNPIDIGGGAFADLYVTINKLGIPGLPQPDPLPGSDPNNPLNWLTQPQIFQDHFTQTGDTWSHTPRADDPHNAQFPAGNFYPGVDPVTLRKILTPEQALLAQHGVLPAQTPEPSTVALVGIGLAGLLLITRKRVFME